MRTDRRLRPRARQRQSARRIALRRAVFLTAVLALLALLVGFAFAGSQSTLAAGTTVAGVDVGGLTQDEAVRVLSARADGRRADADHVHRGRRVVRALGVAARRQRRLGGGGERRCGRRRRVRAAARLQATSGAVLRDRRLPRRSTAYDAAVDYKLDQIAKAVARGGVDAKLVRKGLSVQVVEGQAGRKLDRSRPRLSSSSPSLASTEARRSRSRSRRRARVDAADLEEAAAKARVALSAPIRLAYGETRWRVPRWKIASLLTLPVAGNTDVALTGRGAEEYLERLSATVSRKPQDARFQVTATGKIVVRPSAPGLLLDIPATAKAIAAAAFSTDRRTAKLVVRVAEPARTTADREGDGHHGCRLLVHDDLRRHAGAPQQRAARRRS